MAGQAERIIKNIEILSVFVKMFSTDLPTRATVQVAKLAFEAKIEISAIAIK